MFLHRQKYNKTFSVLINGVCECCRYGVQDPEQDWGRGLQPRVRAPRSGQRHQGRQDGQHLGDGWGG